MEEVRASTHKPRESTFKEERPYPPPAVRLIDAVKIPRVCAISISRGVGVGDGREGGRDGEVESERSCLGNA